MITITRLLARQVKAIGRHLLGAKKYALPAVQVTAGTEGLRFAACDGERGFEFRESAPQPECQIRAPLELFRELAANKPLLVTLSPATLPIYPFLSPNPPMETTTPPETTPAPVAKRKRTSKPTNPAAGPH